MSNSMTPIEIGVFDNRVHANEFVLGPYSRLELGQGANTITLGRCDAAAMMVTMDRHSMRLNEGSTIPVVGNARYLCNPYGTVVTGLYYLDQPLNNTRRMSELDPAFARGHAVDLTYRNHSVDADADLMKGLVFMPLRGDVYLEATAQTDIRLVLLPKAKIEYVNDIPDGVLSSEPKARDVFGNEYNNIFSRAGDFKMSQITDWIVGTGWGENPLTVGYAFANEKITTYVPSGCALFVRNNSEPKCTFTLKIYDMGDFDRELRS